MGTLRHVVREIGKIKIFLDKYHAEKFTGGIKMGFEEGKPMTFWISDVPDFKNKPVQEGFNLDTTLEMAVSDAFTGTLFFLFERGEISHYYFVKTIQGRKLIEMLDGYGRNENRADGKRRIVAVRSINGGGRKNDARMP